MKASLETNGYAAIATHLREWIVEQNVLPGTPLPKQTELATRYDVSSLTIGRAMRELQDDGFVVAIRRAGSFVAETPPHLNRYVLVFPQQPGEVARNRFMQALANESTRLAEQRGITIECVYGLDGRQERDSYKQLVNDIARRRLAGILFATPPFLLKSTPVVDVPGIPRAAITAADYTQPNVSTVSFAESAFAERAFARLQKAGRRHVAVISPAIGMTPWPRLLSELAPRYGLESRPYWLQGVDPRNPASSRQCAHLLFNPDQRLLPDALIVADDNILEEATIGLTDAGVSPPDDLTVIAHCNYPWPTPSRVPVSRLGFDAREVLERMLEATDRQSAGEKESAMPPIRPLFEDEYRALREEPLHAHAHEIHASVPFTLSTP